jgi:hypothetical protein
MSWINIPVFEREPVTRHWQGHVNINHGFLMMQFKDRMDWLKWGNWRDLINCGESPRPHASPRLKTWVTDPRCVRCLERVRGNL